MRVLISVETPAQLRAAVPLGWGLRTNGHDVCLATPPELATSARTSGLPGTVDTLTGFAALWRPDLLLTATAAPEVEVPVVVLRTDLSRVEGPMVDPLPACFPAPAERIAVRPVPYDELAVLPDWLRKPPRRSRVCVIAPGGLAEVDGLNVEVVVPRSAVRDGDRITPATRVVDRVPLAEVLPTCAAVVHDGALATVCAAVLHGVPQLVVGDLDVGSAGVPAGHGAVERLLTDESVHEAVAGLRAELLARPSPAGVVPDLEKAAAR